MANYTTSRAVKQEQQPFNFFTNTLPVVLCLFPLFCCFCTESAFALSNGDKVQASGTVNVRQSAAGSVLGTQTSGSQGVIVGGPTVAPLNGTSYTWWNVTFSSAPNGWVADIGLTAIVPPVPTQSSPGSGSSPGPLVSLPVVLSWNATSGANGYGAYISDLTTSSLVYNNDTVGNVTSVSIPAGTLTPGHAFRWNMRASDSAGFSGYSGLLYFQVQSALPSITSLSENPVTGANSAKPITINGSGFVSGAQVNLKCSAFSVDATLAATFVSSSGLQVTATFGNDPSSWTATVINPGNVSSSPYTFTVQAPAPVIQSLSPSSAMAGGAAFTLTVSGNTFDAGSAIQWNGVNLTTGHTISEGGLTTALTAQVPASDIVSAGTAQVTVYNPSPGGGTSSGVTFTINPNGPSLVFGFDSSNIQQPNVINWSSVASSQVSYNSQNYPTTFVILRASKGNADVDNCRFKDPNFTSRAAAAASAGLTVGAYHVAGVTNISTHDYYNPVSEADFFVAVAGNWIKQGNMRPCLDVEDHSCGTLSTFPGLASWVDQWMQEVVRLTGVTPVIYCDNTFANLLQSLSSKYDIWIARPGTDPGTVQTAAPWNVVLDQYNWNGTVSGINTTADLDVFQGTPAQFQSKLLIGNITPPPTVSIALASVPPGLSVIADGTGYPITPQHLVWQSGSSHTISAVTEQVSVNGQVRFDFLSWSDGGVQSHSIAPTSSGTYTATYSVNFLLDTTASPLARGTIGQNPVGPWYALGASVQLTATPTSGFAFSSWSGVDNYANNVATVLMNGYRNVTATFTQITPPSFAGGVSVSSGVLHATLSGLSSGTTVVLEASTNLQVWAPIQTNVVAGSSLLISNPVSLTNRMQFLRAVVH